MGGFLEYWGGSCDITFKWSSQSDITLSDTLPSPRFCPQMLPTRFIGVDLATLAGNQLPFGLFGCIQGTWLTGLSPLAVPWLEVMSHTFIQGFIYLEVREFPRVSWTVTLKWHHREHDAIFPCFCSCCSVKRIWAIICGAGACPLWVGIWQH